MVPSWSVGCDVIREPWGWPLAAVVQETCSPFAVCPYHLGVLPFPNDPTAWQDFYVMMGGANAALTRVSAPITRTRLISLLIRVFYIYASVSLIFGIGGGFYVLALVVVVTLGRTMASAWALLTALE